jgi:hypothetical protein
MISQRWRKYLYPYALEIIAPGAFCEVDSCQNEALKTWFDVFTSSEVMGDE